MLEGVITNLMNAQVASDSTAKEFGSST